MESKSTISGIVKSRVNTFKEGYVFSYLDIEGSSKNREAIIKALNRLAEKGILDKLSKGKFFKPSILKHGKSGLDINEIVKDLLENKGEKIGYITGLSTLNKSQLTTEKSPTIQIGRSTFKPPLRRAHFTIKFVLQKHIITEENIEMLQVLDCLKLLKGISEDAQGTYLKSIAKIIRKFNKKQRELLIQLSLKYPSSTRMFLGYIFEQESINAPLSMTEDLRNPLGEFNTGLRAINKFIKENYIGK